METDRLEILAEQAKAASHSGDHEKSADCYREMLALEPEAAPFWLLYGSELTDLKLWDEARAALDEALATAAKAIANPDDFAVETPDVPVVETPDEPDVETTGDTVAAREAS